MREYITDVTLANQIQMKRSLFTGAFLVVEGSSDKLVYRLIVDCETCKIEVAYGRKTALGVIRILNSRGFEGVLAIVDSDMSKITGEVSPEQNILQTDLHDLECMMLNSPAFERILEEYGSEERVSAFAEQTPLVARQLALNASPLGCLRLISLLKNLNLKFEGLTFTKFVDANDLTIDVPKMVCEVLNKSQKHSLDQTQLVEEVSNEAKQNHDCWQISCGHDIVEILAIAIRRIFSGKSTGAVAIDDLERCMRLAYDAEHLRNTELYRAIAKWEASNGSYAILDRA